MEPEDIASELEHVLLTEEQIRERMRELAAQIDADYAGKDLLLVGVLKGAVMVMADLARSLQPLGRHGLDGGVVVRVGDHVDRASSGS